MTDTKKNKNGEKLNTNSNVNTIINSNNKSNNNFNTGRFNIPLISLYKKEKEMVKEFDIDMICR